MDSIIQIKVNLLIQGQYILGIGFSFEEVYQDMLHRHKGLIKNKDKIIAIRKALNLQ